MKNSFPKIIVALCLLRYLLAFNGNLAVWPHAIHDDGHFISQGVQISTGRWLGDFNQYTLIKNPLYPVLLGILNCFRISLQNFQEFIYILACCAFFFSVNKYLKKGFSLVFLSLLLFNPIVYWLNRVSREFLYISLLLFFFAGCNYIIESYKYTRKKRFIISFGFSLIWALLVLLREESVFLIPCICYIFVAFSWKNIKNYGVNDTKIKTPILFTWIVSVKFLIVSIFCLINYIKYNFYGLNEFENASWKSAYSLISSFDKNEKERYLPAPQKSLAKIYEASPTFRTLKIYLESDCRVWLQFGRGLVTQGNSEDFVGDWFRWALRDAAAKAGYYNNWKSAESLYKSISQEILSNTKVSGSHFSFGILPPLLLEKNAIYLIKNVLGGLKKTITYNYNFETSSKLQNYNTNILKINEAEKFLSSCAALSYCSYEGWIRSSNKIISIGSVNLINNNEKSLLSFFYPRPDLSKGSERLKYTTGFYLQKKGDNIIFINDSLQNIFILKQTTLGLQKLNDESRANEIEVCIDSIKDIGTKCLQFREIIWFFLNRILLFVNPYIFVAATIAFLCHIKCKNLMFLTVFLSPCIYFFVRIFSLALLHTYNFHCLDDLFYMAAGQTCFYICCFLVLFAKNNRNGNRGGL
jgi:hypothetical protein